MGRKQGGGKAGKQVVRVKSEERERDKESMIEVQKREGNQHRWEPYLSSSLLRSNRVHITPSCGGA